MFYIDTKIFDTKIFDYLYEDGSYKENIFGVLYFIFWWSLKYKNWSEKWSHLFSYYLNGPFFMYYYLFVSTY